MDRIGLPTAVRSSARPRHRSVDGGAPQQPARNIALFVASAVLAQPRHSHAFLPSAVPGSHRERLLKGIHAIDQNHFYSGQPWSISRLLADTHGPS